MEKMERSDGVCLSLPDMEQLAAVVYLTAPTNEQVNSGHAEETSCSGGAPGGQEKVVTP